MMEHTHCQELIASISEYIDGDLSSELCQDLETHLSECENCRVVVNTLRKTIEIYHQASENQTLPGGARERLFQHLHLEDYLNHS